MRGRAEIRLLVSGLLCAMLAAMAPGGALAESYTTPSGDVGLTRSDAQSRLAMKATELFAIGISKQNPRKLAAAAEIMARLSDAVVLRLREPSPVIDLSPQKASYGAGGAADGVATISTPAQVLSLAIDMARRQGDAGLVAILKVAKRGLPAAGETTPSGDAPRQGCRWANCCGRWGCWRWCQWW